MPKEIQPLLKQLKSDLKLFYGKQFRKAYLFGSYVRGDYNLDSDIDMLIVLSDFKKYGTELRRTSKLIGDLSPEHETTVSVVFPASRNGRPTTCLSCSTSAPRE